MRISDWSSDVCSSDLKILSEGDGADVVEALQQWCEGEDEDDCFQARVIEERRQRLCQQCDNRGGAQPAQQTEGPGGIIVTALRFLVLDQRQLKAELAEQIGRASCRERVCQYV